MEKTYQEYIQFIEEAIQEETIKKSLASIGQVGHFLRTSDGELKPQYYPGFTLITPTSGEDPANSAVYKMLLTAQNIIAEKISAHKYVKAPEAALHMTIARLISGELFVKNILGARENDVLRALGALLGRIPAQQGLAFEIRGISAMHGIIAALVTAEDENSYRCLQSFRDVVYKDKILLDYGVERKRGFTGHITLLYIEEELSNDEKAGIAESVNAVNHLLFPEAVPFYISCAEVRRFNNYLSFARENDWPVFRFNSNGLPVK